MIRDVLRAQLVQRALLSKMLGGVDEDTSSGFLHFLSTGCRPGCRWNRTEIRGQADDGVNVAVLQQLGSDAFLGSAAERARRAVG